MPSHAGPWKCCTRACARTRRKGNSAHGWVSWWGASVARGFGTPFLDLSLPGNAEARAEPGIKSGSSWCQQMGAVRHFALSVGICQSPTSSCRHHRVPEECHPDPAGWSHACLAGGTSSVIEETEGGCRPALGEEHDLLSQETSLAERRDTARTGAAEPCWGQQ